MDKITSDNYVQHVVVTESVDFEAIQQRLSDMSLIRLLHAAQGICTEAGELTDQLKKHIFYGAELDTINLIEELGDLTWYIGLALDEIGCPMNELLQKNIAKLAARYPEEFKEVDALNRDLEKERGVLENLAGNKLDKNTNCPYCSATIRLVAERCWHCNRELKEKDFK